MCNDLLVTDENAARLERATAEYFDNMSPEVAAEETALGAAMSEVTTRLDLDQP